MGQRLYESMTRIPLYEHVPNPRRGWDAKPIGCVRVWRSEASLEAACEPDNADILLAMTALGDTPTPQQIIAAIEQLDRIEAVEVLNEQGNGALLYPNWE